jgi:hypothetical protein
MDRYKNLSGGSNVFSYVIGDDRISVQFKDGSTYLYTNARTGIRNIDQMKKLAVQGRGLNSFINTNVRKLYEAKLR